MLWLWGAFAFMCALVPAGLAQTVGRRLRSAAILSSVLAALATGLILPVETAAVAGGWRDALRVGPLDVVLFQTSIGSAWQVQAGAALCLLVVVMGDHRRPGPIAAAAGLNLVATTFSGHAVMQDGIARVLHQVNDAIHLLSGGAWLGALVPLWLILRRLAPARDHRDEVVALRRFSSAGHVAVALVVGTGVINDLLILGGWPLDWRIAYQALLSLKIATVAVMVGLAVLNRYAFVPRLARDREGALRRLRAVTLTELWLGAAVVGMVAVFGLLEPTAAPTNLGGGISMPMGHSAHNG